MCTTYENYCVTKFTRTITSSAITRYSSPSTIVNLAITRQIRRSLFSDRDDDACAIRSRATRATARRARERPVSRLQFLLARLIIRSVINKASHTTGRMPFLGNNIACSAIFLRLVGNFSTLKPLSAGRPSIARARASALDVRGRARGNFFVEIIF